MALRELFQGLAEGTPEGVNAYRTVSSVRQRQQTIGQEEKKLQSQEKQDFIKGADLNRLLELEGVPRSKSPFTDDEVLPYNQAKEALEYLKSIQQAKDKANFMSPYAQVRAKNTILQRLPSNMNQTTTPGFAARIQLRARTGKSLLANPNANPETVRLAMLDLAQAVQGGAIHLDTLRNMQGYGSTLGAKFADIAQKITAQPQSAYNPEMRKYMVDTLEDLEKTTRPFIENQMDNLQATYQDMIPDQNYWMATRSRELGDNLPSLSNVNLSYQTSPQPVSTPSNAGASARESLLKKFEQAKQGR